MNTFYNFSTGYNRLKNELLPKICIYDDENCEKKIVKAHSVQNNRILNSISENGEVLRFYHDSMSEELEVKALAIGKKKASTFSGFCKYHDMKIFQPIEIQEYQSSNLEQQFLFAYRAFSFDYYAKKYQSTLFDKLFEVYSNHDSEFLKKYFKFEPPNTNDFYNYYINYFGRLSEEAKDSFEQMEKLRVAFNTNLLKNRYYKIKTYEVRFNERFEIAASGAPTVDYDLNGNMINDLPRLHSYLSFMFITVFPQKNNTVVLLSCTKNDIAKYNRFFKQIEQLSEERKRIVISVLLVCYIENIYMSPRLWNCLDDSEKIYLENIFHATIGNHPKELYNKLDFNIFIK
ncbi:MAG: hypothetical protein HQ509_01210 [Candidatus Marinimicrobia bacterium]|nr:hypothetical protein [Candidatus Neomarinimicrobiota bacterium]